MRRHLTEDEKVPERLVHLCYNGIDTEVFRPKAAGATTAVHPGLQDASIVIGIVCSLRPEKGLDTLMASFTSVARDDAGARLLIVGSGPELDNLQKQAQSLGIFNRCVFVPATDLVTPWLHAMDIFVLPSLSEAFSNALMEAMACGCCVVASNVGGNPELAGNPRRGVLFQPGDVDNLTSVLRLLMSNPTRREALGAAASDFVRTEFSMAASALRMANIYELSLSMRGIPQLANER
jgi:glycosyltransferase involved in cell wall biosynthesis